MAIHRVLVPEILDHLDFRDPEAIRSRRDLRWIHAFMGNFRWIRRVLHHSAAGAGVVEAGAGDGTLCRRMARWFPGRPLAAVDFLPRPDRLPSEVAWHAGDVFEELPKCGGGMLVAVMFLHHFSTEELERLGRILSRFQAVAVCEPWRSAQALALSRLAAPLAGRVTRHDMPASIRAGFVPGELRDLLGLRNWRVEEAVDWRGGLRFRAWRE